MTYNIHQISSGISVRISEFISPGSLVSLKISRTGVSCSKNRCYPAHFYRFYPGGSRLRSQKVCGGAGLTVVAAVTSLQLLLGISQSEERMRWHQPIRDLFIVTGFSELGEIPVFLYFLLNAAKLDLMLKRKAPSFRKVDLGQKWMNCRLIIMIF